MKPMPIYTDEEYAAIQGKLETGDTLGAQKLMLAIIESKDTKRGRGWRFCPHWFGWSYNTHRRRRFCRFCAYQQRLDKETGKWIPAETESRATS